MGGCGKKQFGLRNLPSKTTLDTIKPMLVWRVEGGLGRKAKMAKKQINLRNLEQFVESKKN